MKPSICPWVAFRVESDALLYRRGRRTLPHTVTVKSCPEWLVCARKGLRVAKVDISVPRTQSVNLSIGWKEGRRAKMQVKELMAFSLNSRPGGTPWANGWFL